MKKAVSASFKRSTPCKSQICSWRGDRGERIPWSQGSASGLRALCHDVKYLTVSHCWEGFVLEHTLHLWYNWLSSLFKRSINITVRPAFVLGWFVVVKNKNKKPDYFRDWPEMETDLIHSINFLKRMWGLKSTNSQDLSIYTCNYRYTYTLWKTDADLANVRFFGLANTTLTCSFIENENLETKINHVKFLSSFL